MSSIQDTLLQLQNATNRVNFQKGQESLGSSELGPDAFLRLLMEQLRHQDPLNPMDSQDFLGQQAQFTQIEKLDKLTSTIAQANGISQASSMVGKTVELIDDFGEPITGKVDSVLIGSDGVGLEVGGNVYSIGQIYRIVSD